MKTMNFWMLLIKDTYNSLLFQTGDFTYLYRCYEYLLHSVNFFLQQTAKSSVAASTPARSTVTLSSPVSSRKNSKRLTHKKLDWKRRTIYSLLSVHLQHCVEELFRKGKKSMFLSSKVVAEQIPFHLYLREVHRLQRRITAKWRHLLAQGCRLEGVSWNRPMLGPVGPRLQHW